MLLRSGKLAAAVLVAVSGWLLNDALRSPRYSVRVVEAWGTQALTTEEVTALANVQATPIWYVKTDEVAARIAQSPYVEQAKARVILPDRLEVTVKERKPEVQWLHDGIAFAVTWDGLVVDHAGRKPATAALSETAELSATGSLSDTNAITPTTPLSPTDGVAPPPAPPESFAGVVTVVDTTPNRPLKIGDRVDADALELARRVILRAPSELPAPITRIEWDAGLGISLIVGEGRQVVLGKSDDLDRKLATLRFLLHDSTPFSYLDLRPTAPYYKP